MSKELTPHSGNGIISRVPGLGILAAYGSTVPSDGAAGYAPACTFQQTDASTVNTCLYVNIGTATSCNFDPLLG